MQSSIHTNSGNTLCPTPPFFSHPAPPNIAPKPPAITLRGFLNEAVNIMTFKKTALLILFGTFGAHAYAADNAESKTIPIETYDYATKLDIEHVISISEPANECAPVPVRMTYEDSYGERHVLQYQVMGTGCSS
ncbi:DUF2790 domain-containing protein [Pseudomonas sp. HY13-MNA-CIBAN-0226]|jgi:hypothetical protein